MKKSISVLKQSMKKRLIKMAYTYKCDKCGKGMNTAYINGFAWVCKKCAEGIGLESCKKIDEKYLSKVH